MTIELNREQQLYARHGLEVYRRGYAKQLADRDLKPFHENIERKIAIIDSVIAQIPEQTE